LVVAHIFSRIEKEIKVDVIQKNKENFETGEISVEVNNSSKTVAFSECYMQKTYYMQCND
jgi:hypothetical protein